jgi:TetR/AcrR family transcriptional regulator, cholesterol catabolism regulator
MFDFLEPIVTEKNSGAKERVLDAAESHFHLHGYKAVTMQEIADALAVRQASLYYHVPGGKEQLFVQVIERRLARHQQGLCQAIQAAPRSLREQLTAALSWFSSQPPVNFLVMMQSDMPLLSAENQSYLSQLAYRATFAPLRQLFVKAEQRGEIRSSDVDTLAGLMLSIVDGMSYIRTHQPGAPPATQMIDTILSIILEGLYPRAELPIG